MQIELRKSSDSKTGWKTGVVFREVWVDGVKWGCFVREFHGMHGYSSHLAWNTKRYVTRSKGGHQVSYQVRSGDGNIFQKMEPLVREAITNGDFYSPEEAAQRLRATVDASLAAKRQQEQDRDARFTAQARDKLAPFCIEDPAAIQAVVELMIWSQSQ